MHIRYQTLKQWYEKYERVLIPAMLVLGVAVDFATFTSINTTTAFLLLGVYMGFAGWAIVFLNRYNAETIAQKKNIIRYSYLAAPLILQFTFGALLSAAFIFYFFSGTVFVSWPFFVLVVFLMVSNEIFRDYYTRPTVQVGVFYFILFTLASIVFPFAWKAIGVFVFVMAGALSVLAGIGYIAFLLRFAPQLKPKLPRFFGIMGVVFAIMNGLYFFNLIPPVPLALRDMALSHEVQRVGNTYALLVEKEPWWEILKPGHEFHKSAGERVYVYSAIFAPKGLTTKIVHRWEYYDEAKKEWMTRDRLTFPINGGAGRGYRGYSYKSNTEVGRWRVQVETESGQALGRMSFHVIPASVPQKFLTVIK